MFLVCYLLLSYLLGAYLFCVKGTNTGHGWPTKVTVGLLLAPIAVPIVLFVNVLLSSKRP